VVANEHKHDFLLAASRDRVFRITFRNGEVFHLREFAQIDASIYGYPDGWSATIVAFEKPASEDRVKLFRPGSGIDLYESDINEIADVATGDILFSS
jgi:hypothetical protein